jgi:hypothetical protein
MKDSAAVSKLFSVLPCPFLFDRKIAILYALCIYKVTGNALGISPELI